jgi:hypothetical protein
MKKEETKVMKKRHGRNEGGNSQRKNREENP